MPTSMETHASLVGVLDAQKDIPVPFRLTVLNHSAGFALAAVLHAYLPQPEKLRHVGFINRQLTRCSTDARSEDGWYPGTALPTARWRGGEDGQPCHGARLNG